MQACVAYAQSTPTSEVSGVAQPGPAFPITAIRFEGNQLVDEAPLQQAAAFSLGNARHLSDLLALKKAIAEVYEARGWRMVAIGLPPRIEADGLIVISLHEQQLAGLQVSGQKTSGQADIRAALPSLRENQALNFNTLASELALANDNPVRQLSVDFSADEQSGILAKVQVQESDPFRMGLTLDNTGTPDSGRSRMGASFQHHNLWGRGHSLVAGLSTSDLGPDRLIQAHAAYQAPLPSAGGQVKLSASYSNANSASSYANPYQVTPRLDGSSMIHWSTPWGQSPTGEWARGQTITPQGALIAGLAYDLSADGGNSGVAHAVRSATADGGSHCRPDRLAAIQQHRPQRSGKLYGARQCRIGR